jgi:hypothetical protein
MAFIDKLAIFSPFTTYGGSPDSLAISTATASSVTYDVTGAGVGNVPPQVFGQPNSGTLTFGADMGVGDGLFVPFVLIVIGQTLASGTSMNFSLQSAPDNGSGAAGTWTTAVETGAIAISTNPLTAGLAFTLPFARRTPGAPLPRFYRMLYTPSGTFSAGSVSAGIMVGNINPTDIGLYSSNFSFGVNG